jgi:3,4-dihydroxy 2-butanone 4-phosphate synthase/GTP cyclohydrolase II
MQSGPFAASPWSHFDQSGSPDSAHFAAAMHKIAERGAGCIVCLNQRGPATDWTEWDPSLPPSPTRSMGHDPLDYGVGAQILHGLGLRNVALLTQNPMRRVGIEGYGLHIVQNVALY